MRTLGLIGGIGWESTAAYYRFLNEDLRGRRGSLFTARILLNSLQFQTIDSLARSRRWQEAGVALADAARTLESAGAEGLVLCSNLMHFVADQIEAAVSIPLLHLGDALVDAARATSAHVGVIGTQFTVEHGFLLNRRPHPRWGCARVYTPAPADSARVDRIIYDEVCQGILRKESAEAVLRIARGLRQNGAKIVVLVSSELSLLLSPENSPSWIYDSTELHAAAAVCWMLGEEKTGTDFTRPTLTALPGGGVRKRSQLPVRKGRIR